MPFSVVIPALNEERGLAATLEAVHAARRFASRHAIDIIVVDNDSTDRTASIAAAMGVSVVREAVRSVARARNTGAAAATGDCLIFLDADTLVPENLFAEIARAFEDPACIGGAVDAPLTSTRLAVRAYLGFWRVVGALFGMGQGAAQFCRRAAFEAAGGYDESIWMGEDVDFYWRLKSLARRTGRRVEILEHVRVCTSMRRFDAWPFWKILVFTNPLLLVLFRRRRRVWRAWYDRPVR
jgi:glycosyltransferase involved in cell wall biosynthesis